MWLGHTFSQRNKATKRAGGEGQRQGGQGGGGGGQNLKKEWQAIQL